MGRLALEVADIPAATGPLGETLQHDHLSLGQLKVMSAIEQCRTRDIGWSVLCCPACDHQDIAYNSCRKPALPQVSGQRSQAAGSKPGRPICLPVEYYHVVFTLPAPISAIA